MQNKSVTSRLLGQPDPGLAVKRRVRMGKFPQVKHSVDVKREGTPPSAVPPICQVRWVIPASDTAQLSLGNIGAEYRLMIRLVEVGDSAQYQVQQYTSGYVPAALRFTEGARSDLDIGLSNYAPIVIPPAEVAVTDGAQQTTAASGEYTQTIPSVVVSNTNDAASQTLAQGGGTYIETINPVVEQSASDAATQVFALGTGDYVQTIPSVVTSSNSDAAAQQSAHAGGEYVEYVDPVVEQAANDAAAQATASGSGDYVQTIPPVVEETVGEAAAQENTFQMGDYASGGATYATAVVSDAAEQSGELKAGAFVEGVPPGIYGDDFEAYALGGVTEGELDQGSGMDYAWEFSIVT